MRIVKSCFVVSFLICFYSIQAQSITKYWVQFTDKDNTPYSISNPSDYLSQKAIDRREKQGISIKENDLPVDPAYINAVTNLGANVVLRSKWFNAITVESNDTNFTDSLDVLPFVNAYQVTNVFTPKTTSDKFEIVTQGVGEEINENEYGAGYHQLRMIEGDLLHAMGFTGKGMTIAVMDGGFRNVDIIDGFAKMRDEGRLLGGWDFVDNDATYIEKSGHGTNVLSTMAAYLPNEFIGTAPDASYYLFITEDVSSESLVEEDNWIAAAEMADSLGVDVLNTSLSYTTFDDASTDHTYADLNGNTTRISRGADIAASKGMLVVNSAANEGNSSWFYIGAPADGDSVLAVGAVDSLEQVANFSSHGPSADGDIKPNVCAQGRRTKLLNTAGAVSRSNGTSFSAPIMAGMAACLWQSCPNSTNMEVFHAIEESAHKYNNPDAEFGYGIPNFYNAYADLVEEYDSVFASTNLPLIFPNPFKEHFRLIFTSSIDEEIEITIHNIQGQLMYENIVKVRASNHLRMQINELKLAESGEYILRLKRNDKWSDYKIVKL